MEFSPYNPIVKLCLQGQGMQEKGLQQEAAKLFLQAWNESTQPFERIHVGLVPGAWVQVQAADRLKWLEPALQAALEIHDGSMRRAPCPPCVQVSPSATRTWTIPKRRRATAHWRLHLMTRRRTRVRSITAPRQTCERATC